MLTARQQEIRAERDQKLEAARKPRFVASKPLDVQLTAVGRGSAQNTAIQNIFLDQSIRWAVPPLPPSGVTVSASADGLQVSWPPGSNSIAYGLQERLPGQSYSLLTATTASSYLIQSGVPSGTNFRVDGLSVNQGRFTAYFLSGFSPEVTFSGTLPPASSSLAVTISSLKFSYEVFISGRRRAAFGTDALGQKQLQSTDDHRFSDWGQLVISEPYNFDDPNDNRNCEILWLCAQRAGIVR
jgi:hypothetical protein